LSSGTRAHEEGMSSNRQLVRDGEAITLDELTVRRWERGRCVGKDLRIGFGHTAYEYIISNKKLTISLIDIL
jgi:hypothetical protein